MEIFTNEQIAIDTLPKFEEVTLLKLEPNYWKVISINLCLFLVTILIGIGLLYMQNQHLKPFLWYFIGAYIIFAILLFVLYRTSFKKRGYALRQKDIIYKSGIIAEKTTIIPLNRIQHVALKEGFFSRLFKLGTLQINTADGVSGQVVIAGLPIAVAKTIKEALINSIDNQEIQNELADGNGF